MRKHSVIQSTRRAAVTAALFAVFVLTLSPDVSAQSMGDIENRLSRMQNEIQTLSRALYKGEAMPTSDFSSGGGGMASGASQADLEVRLQQMETELRGLTGKIEEQSYAVDQVKADVERRLSDMELRMIELERRSGGGVPASNTGMNGSAPPPQPSSDQSGMQTQEFGTSYDNPAPLSPDESSYNAEPSSSLSSQDGLLENANAATSDTGLVGDSAAASYENAFSLMKSSNYDAAQREFDNFLRAYPDHALAGNAQYWLGETFYVQGNYEKAARIFAEGYQKYPQGSKSADNLLKLGLSLASIGNKNDACVALRQLKKDFTTGAGPAHRRADQEMTRLGC
jgi:tol-pal system protein YbgF